MILRDLYSIKPTSTSDRCALVAKYSHSLKVWRAGIPHFLDADSKDSAPLIPIFQRQRNVLNLAYWHTVILTHRGFLLKNFTQLQYDSRRQYKGIQKAQFEDSVGECLRAAISIVDTVDELFRSGLLFRSFWVSLLYDRFSGPCG